MNRMKALIVLSMMAFTTLFAQSPQAFNYQAVARDNSGDPLANQSVGIQFILHQTTPAGVVVYTEAYSTTTTAQGLFTLQVGNGTASVGTFSTLDWGAGPYFLEVGLDATGGNTYLSMGTQQMLSVPYALYAESSGSTGSSNTLDEAYDEGRIITADSGAVYINGEDGLLVTGAFGSGDTIDVSGGGTRMFFNPYKAAFRAGSVYGDGWDNSNVGLHSTAMGRSTNASGITSTAMGYETTASGDGSTAMGSGSNAVGHFSTAFGQYTTASGHGSTAMGDQSTALGNGSTAMGVETNASGHLSTAFGQRTTASGTASTALGIYTNASGQISTAMGVFTTASGSVSTAMGDYTTAKSGYETAMGRYNTDYTPNDTTGWDAADRLFVVGNGANSSNLSNALTILKNGNTGIGTDSPTELLHLSGTSGTDGILFPDNTFQTTAYSGSPVDGFSLDEAYGQGRIITADSGAVYINGTDGLLVTGTLGIGDTINVSGAGTRMFFNPNKSAFRAGTVASDQWDESNVGLYSTAIGQNSIASEFGSTAIGFWTNAPGAGAIAMGALSTASGEISTAFGQGSIASGNYSTAMGQYATASGRHSFSMGIHTTAESRYETVMGCYDTDYTPNGTIAWDAADRLFVVGNGTFGNRSNALTILKNGNTGIGTDNPTGLLHLSGTSGTDGILFPDSTLQTTAYTGSGNLDEAYDQGRIITADSGAVYINGEDGFLVTGTLSSGDSIEVSGGGTRMFFNPNKAAFRAGYVDGNEWDNSNVGDYSTALGKRITASGTSSTAMGAYTTASGVTSTAMGKYSIASGNYSTSIGSYTTARSAYETTIGVYSTDYTPNNPFDWNQNDRLFVVGNGEYNHARSNALTILKNGNTGIGTDSPTELLHLSGTSGTDGILFPDSTFQTTAYTGTNTFDIINDADNDTKIQVEESADEDHIRFDVAGSQAMVIDNSGDVGIGTNTIGAALEIATNNSSEPTLLLGRQSGEPSVTGDDYLILDGNEASSSNAALNFYSSGDVILANGGGDVAIGTVAAPDAKLHVLGDIKIEDGTQAAGAILTSDANGLASWSEAIVLDGGKVIIDDLQFTGGSPSSGEVLTSDANGNATWSAPQTISTVYAKTKGETNYNNSNSWRDVTSPVSMSGSPTFKLEANMTLRLTTGSGTDQFEIRVKIECGGNTVYSDTTGYTPGEGSTDHDNYKIVPYLDIASGLCSLPSTATFTLQVRNIGDDAWAIRNRVLIVTKYE